MSEKVLGMAEACECGASFRSDGLCERTAARFEALYGHPPTHSVEPIEEGEGK